MMYTVNTLLLLDYHRSQPQISYFPYFLCYDCYSIPYVQRKSSKVLGQDNYTRQISFSYIDALMYVALQ